MVRRAGGELDPSEPAVPVCGGRPRATQRGASYLASELHDGVAGVKSGVINPCRMRETREVSASKVRVRP